MKFKPSKNFFLMLAALAFVAGLFLLWKAYKAPELFDDYDEPENIKEDETEKPGSDQPDSEK